MRRSKTRQSRERSILKLKIARFCDFIVKISALKTLKFFRRGYKRKKKRFSIKFSLEYHRFHFSNSDFLFYVYRIKTEIKLSISVTVLSWSIDWSICISNTLHIKQRFKWAYSIFFRTRGWKNFPRGYSAVVVSIIKSWISRGKWIFFFKVRPIPLYC